jgi:16S rRNA (adenine1518-N6/adenine1519-N6)-dimethyltransferase
MTHEPLQDPRHALRAHGFRPRHKLGQNFIQSDTALEAVLEAAELRPTDAVLEIGPGTGTLTTPLVRHAGCVVAVELDDKLVSIARARLSGIASLHLIQGDILQLDHVALVRERCKGDPTYKVVANLPYYLTSHLLRRLLETEPRPSLIVVMVQKEVAERAAATPPDMNLLGVSVQYYSTPRIAALVPADAFTPAPEVDSAVLQLRTRTEPPFPDLPAQRYFRVVSAGFGQKRKTLLNALSSNLKLPRAVVGPALDRASVPPSLRAQRLTLEDWARVCRELPTE